MDIKTLSSISEDYVPIIYKLPDVKDDIFKNDLDLKLSKNIDYPRFSYGFHHFIHQSKNNMEVTQQFKGKKKVYYVINKFERYIDDYKLDINGQTTKYFSINKQPKILSRGFFKLWEMMFFFDIVHLNKNFISAHLAEGPGSFIQATMFYRDMFTKKGDSKNDKYYAVTLHSDDMKKYIPPLDESFIKHYKKEKPVRFMQHRTYPREISRTSRVKDNGDLTSVKTIKQFGGNFKNKKADLVTADGGFNWVNENTQEQEAFRLILGQIITALNIQAKNGNFICKLFENYTNITMKLICSLRPFYKEVYVCKPYTSRKSNSEKYLICMGYKGQDAKKIKILETLLTKSKGKLNIVDYFPNYKIPQDLKSTIINLNKDISNRQFIAINSIITFINKQNYRGEKYQRKRNEQIEAAKFWGSTFYPDKKDFHKSKKNINGFVNEIINT